jgi:transcriptional regulator with PAS, ATPase and Fis domain
MKISHSKRQKRRGHRSGRQLVRLRKELGVKTLNEIKQNEITRVLVLAKGDKALAAALLGIGKTTLYRTVAKKSKRRGS